MPSPSSAESAECGDHDESFPIDYCKECQGDNEQIERLDAALQDFERAKGGKP